MLPPINRRTYSELPHFTASATPARLDDQSLASDQFKTIDSTAAFLTFHGRRKKKSSFGTSSGRLALRGQRSISLETLIAKCKESIREEDDAMKVQLAEAQTRIQGMLRDLTRRPKELNSYASVKSRKKFLQEQDYISHESVRKMLIDNRMKFKRARVMAIGN